MKRSTSQNPNSIAFSVNAPAVRLGGPPILPVVMTTSLGMLPKTKVDEVDRMLAEIFWSLQAPRAA